jgi:hypothetical protein
LLVAIPGVHDVANALIPADSPFEAKDDIALHDDARRRVNLMRGEVG